MGRAGIANPVRFANQAAQHGNGYYSWALAPAAEIFAAHALDRFFRRDHPIQVRIVLASGGNALREAPAGAGRCVMTKVL